MEIRGAGIVLKRCHLPKGKAMLALNTEYNKGAGTSFSHMTFVGGHAGQNCS